MLCQLSEVIRSFPMISMNATTRSGPPLICRSACIAIPSVGKVSRWVSGWIVFFFFFFQHNGTKRHESGLPPCPLHLAFPVLPLELELDRQYCSGTHVLLAVPQWFSAQAVVWLDWANVHLHIICPFEILLVTSVSGLRYLGPVDHLGSAHVDRLLVGGRLSLYFTPHFRCLGRLWYFAILGSSFHGYPISTLNRELGMAKLMRAIRDNHPWKVWFHSALAHLIQRIHLNKGRDSIEWLRWQWVCFEGFIFANWLTCTFLVWPGQSRTVFVTTNDATSYVNLE